MYQIIFLIPQLHVVYCTGSFSVLELNSLLQAAASVALECPRRYEYTYRTACTVHSNENHSVGTYKSTAKKLPVRSSDYTCAHSPSTYRIYLFNNITVALLHFIPLGQLCI